MYRLHEAQVTGQTLVWDKPDLVYYIGPDTVLRDSTITIAVPAARLVITRTKFFNCTIRVKRQLNNFPFDGTYFEGCTLRGRYSGCDFGRRIEREDSGISYFSEAGIVDTDLSAARLDGCRFLDCDLSTLRLPLWPCFTVCNPDELLEQALKLPWPGKTRIIPETWEEPPPRTVAVTDDARIICKQFGVSEEELKAVVSRIPGVIM